MPTVASYFELPARGTTAGREVRGAFATFLTMAYILFVNPSILAAAGVPQGSAVACTALAAGVCCLLMGLVANFPMALAPGMGLNAIVAFTVAPAVVAAGIAPKETAWRVAMGLVVLDGLLILVLVLLGLREAVMHAIPRDLRLAIGAGIGLFIAFIGLVNARLVIVPPGTLAALAADPKASMPPVTFGSVRDPVAAVAVVGLLVTAVLVARKVKGALILGIIVATSLALAVGVAHLPDELGRPSFEAAFKADVLGALHWQLLPLLFALMMVDFFDTLGTATAVAETAGLIDESGRVPGIRRILVVDSLSASVGGLLGASSVTSYVESAAGVAEGARTGLHTVVVGLLFLVCIVAAPLAAVVPGAATAPALILVGFLMIVQMAKVNFDHLDTAIPAFVTLLTVPLTYSIAHGIGYGFITFVAIKATTLRFRDVHPLMYLATAAFLAYFIWGKA